MALASQVCHSKQIHKLQVVAISPDSATIIPMLYYSNIIFAYIAGKLAVITGGSSGIGAESARVLARAGCRVFITSRTLPTGEAAIAHMLKQNAAAACASNPHKLNSHSAQDHTHGSINAWVLDLESLSSIRLFVKNLEVMHSLPIPTMTGQCWK